VTDRSLCQDQSLAAKVAEALDGGVGLVQLREKDLPAGEQLALAEEVKAAIAGRALFTVNDRLDVALAVEADGVHLPENGLPMSEARRLAGGDFLVGRSVHSLEAALQAEREGADYLFVGTVFPSRSHPGGPVAGVPLLQEITQSVSTPCFGIGGITAANVRQVMNAGAAGAAVISAILGSPSAEAAARELYDALRTSIALAGGEGR
jgi:thiamine-phosphate diphosphorylase